MMTRVNAVMVAAPLILASCVFSGSETDDFSQEKLATSTSAIRGGTEDSTNAMNESLSLPGCSGTLITNRWVLTANHCVPWGTSPTAYQVRLAANVVGQQSSVVAADGFIRRPCNMPTQHCEDVMLLRLEEPFAVNGSTRGFVRSQWPGSSSSLSGLIRQIGWGGVTGSFQRYADLGVHSVETTSTVGDRVWWNCNSTSAVCQWPGDSGGGGFKTLNGTTFQTTIAAGGDTSGTVTPGSFALSTASPTVRTFLDRSLYTGGGTISGNVSINGQGVQVSKRAVEALDVFWIDSSGTLKTQPYNFGWGPVQGLGAPPGKVLTGKPGSVSWSSDRIDVFVRATDNTLWQRFWTNGSWVSGWFRIGITGVASSPSVSSWSPDRLDIFFKGTDDNVWHMVYEYGWKPGAEWLGGPVISAPAAVSWGPGRIDFVAVGTDHQLWHRFFTATSNTWSGYEPLGGQTWVDPAISSWGVNRLDIYLTDAATQTLRHRWYESSWLDSWIDMDIAAPACNLTATSWGPGRVDIFSCSSGAIWQSYFPRP